MREGGTDIQKALLASLEQVEVARELDPELSRAQIVLVTDGESVVDEQAVVAARSALGSLPIGVSVIALGQENAALRGLVARQRARGEPAFYHFLDDSQLTEIASGSPEHGVALHLPKAPPRNAIVVARELESEFGPLVEELRTLERERSVAAVVRHDAELQTLRGASGENDARVDLVSEGARARTEAQNRDSASLEARYARWFPKVRTGVTAAGAERTPRRETSEEREIEAVVGLLSSVAEVVMLVGGPELARRAEAIELFERMLPDAQLTPARYHELLRDWGSAIAPAISAVHAAASPV
jgi:hypothetical protein